MMLKPLCRPLSAQPSLDGAMGGRSSSRPSSHQQVATLATRASLVNLCCGSSHLVKQHAWGGEVRFGVPTTILDHTA